MAVLRKCSVCEALLDEEDLFCPNCGVEGPIAADPSPLVVQKSTHNFVCQGCGAAMSYDASAQALRCPFCGENKLEPSPDAPMMSPELVVPFAISNEAATAALRAWLDKGIWTPGDLARQALVVGMTAVYVPYWVFSAQTHTYWSADSSKTPFGASGDWFPLTGEHSGEHNGILVGASAALTAEETAQLCPFHLLEGVPPSEVDLNNVIFEQFSLPRKYARPIAQQMLENIDRQDCEEYVPGRCRNMKVNVQARGLSSQPILLPVWIMAYRYRDTLYRFLTNGQTGQATGEKPISWRKIVLVTVVAVAVGLGIFAMLAQ